MSDITDRIWLAAGRQIVTEIRGRVGSLKLDGEGPSAVVHFFDGGRDDTLMQLITRPGHPNLVEFNIYIGGGFGSATGIDVRDDAITIRIGSASHRMQIEGETAGLAAELRIFAHEAIRTCETAAAD